MANHSHNPEGKSPTFEEHVRLWRQEYSRARFAASDTEYDVSHLDELTLFAYGRHELDAKASERVEQHLAKCDFCFRSFTEILGIGTAAAQANYADALLARLYAGLSGLSAWSRERASTIISRIEAGTRAPEPDFVPAAAADRGNHCRVLGPFGSKVRRGFAFRWMACEEAEVYEVKISRDADSAPILEIDVPAAPTQQCVTLYPRECPVQNTGGTTEALDDQLRPGHKYVWSVRALDEFQRTIAYADGMTFEVAEEVDVRGTISAERRVETAVALAAEGFFYDSICLLEQGVTEDREANTQIAKVAVAVIEDRQEETGLTDEDKEQIQMMLEYWKSVLE